MHYEGRHCIGALLCDHISCIVRRVDDDDKKEVMHVLDRDRVNGLKLKKKQQITKAHLLSIHLISL